MSDWQGKAKAAVHDVLSDGAIARWGWLFVAGARWQREALLSDEAIERAARTITPELYYHYDEWDDANEEDRARALKMARTALTAALNV